MPDECRRNDAAIGGELPIKSDEDQNVKGTKFCKKLYHRVC